MSDRQHYVPHTTTSQGMALLKDVSIIGGVVVVLVIITVAVTVYMVIQFLRNVLGQAGKDIGPVGECAAQIIAAQDIYMQKINPATGTNYTPCGAANLAIGDIAADPITTCPKVHPPYSARPPYSIYTGSQCTPPPPD